MTNVVRWTCHQVFRGNSRSPCVGLQCVVISGWKRGRGPCRARASPRHDHGSAFAAAQHQKTSSGSGIAAGIAAVHSRKRAIRPWQSSGKRARMKLCCRPARFATMTSSRTDRKVIAAWSLRCCCFFSLNSSLLTSPSHCLSGCILRSKHSKKNAKSYP